MGIRGPVGLPQNIHALRGTVPGAARGGEKTKPLKLKPAAPEPPDWLDAEARAEWGRVVPELDAQGLLSPVDRAIVASFCSAWSVLARTVEELGKLNSFTAEGSKSTIRAPELVAWRDAVNVLAMLAGKIMATPSDRLRMRLPEVADLDPHRILD